MKKSSSLFFSEEDMTLKQQHHQHQQLQRSPALVLDGLYCYEEETFVEDYACVDESKELYVKKERNDSTLPVFVVEQDLVWEGSELQSLMVKEKETHFGFGCVVSDGSLMAARTEAIGWFMRVRAHYGFNALTCVLAVNYFDRLIFRLKFQNDKPWMCQLAAVACLSLAVKVEETQVPLLLDLQVEESEYVFEAKTIKRMELLVLSILQWRMNPVTPISYFDHITSRLGLKSHLHREFLCRCECLLLCVILDSRFMSYLPSTLATAIMLRVIEDVEPCDQEEYRNQLISVLNVNKADVGKCLKLIIEISGNQLHSHKRKHFQASSSPIGVTGSHFSYDSSNNSWSMASSVSSSPMPLSKRSKIHVQMLLPSANHMCVDMLTSPW